MAVKTVNNGDVFAVQTKENIWAFCKVILVSEYFKEGIYISLYPETSEKPSMPSSLSGDYVEGWWTFIPCIKDWVLVGNIPISASELAMTNCRIDDELLIEDKISPLLDEDDDDKYPYFMGYNSIALFESICEALGQQV